MENIIDSIGQILWFSAFATPLITIPLFWKQKDLKILYRIIFSLLFALAISIVLFSIAMGIMLRHGLGPT
jgi:hypothetical protein